MANRTDMPPAAPRAKKSEARTAKGQFVPGQGSPNPGGLSKTQREFRQAFFDDAARAQQLVRAGLESEDAEERHFCINVALERGLGKPVKASELPVLVAPASLGESDTQSLLARTRSLLAGALAGLEAQREAGELPADVLTTLSNAGGQLAGLLKAEKEAREGSPHAGKSVDELLAEVPPEVLEEHLRKRKGQP